MPLKSFSDSRGNSHSIYIQEKYSSCAIACIATIINLVCNQQLDESRLRTINQKFSDGYKPHPADVEAHQPTFIANLMAYQQTTSPSNMLASQGLFKTSQVGTGVLSIANTLALYNLYSDKNAIEELNGINRSNYLDKLQSKIVLLGIKTPNQSDHAIIIRDIWNDGTCIIYDPMHGLVETKDIEQYYNLFPYQNSLTCPFTVFQNSAKELDLEALNSEPANNEVIATDYFPTNLQV